MDSTYLSSLHKPFCSYNLSQAVGVTLLPFSFFALAISLSNFFVDNWNMCNSSLTIFKFQHLNKTMFRCAMHYVTLQYHLCSFWCNMGYKMWTISCCNTWSEFPIKFLQGCFICKTNIFFLFFCQQWCPLFNLCKTLTCHQCFICFIFCWVHVVVMKMNCLAILHTPCVQHQM